MLAQSGLALRGRAWGETVVIENHFWAIVCTGFAIGFIVVLMI
jgi:hypothetical protein